MSGCLLGMTAVGFAEEVAGNPFGVFPQDLVIDVLEQVELNRFAGAISRLDAVDHNATTAVDEVAVEEGDGGAEARVELGLPVLPVVPIEVAASNAAAVVGEDVEVVGQSSIKKPLHIDLLLNIHRRNLPVEHAFGVFGVALRIATAGTIEDDASMLFLPLSGIRELNAKLRFTDAGGTDDDGQRAGDKAAPEGRIEGGNTGGEARHAEQC